MGEKDLIQTNNTATIDLAYCVPIMNRAEDLKKTLSHNLAVIRPYSGKVKIVVACFDDTPDCANWMKSNFEEALTRGFLELRELPPLAHWHFGWAKNTFRSDLNARYYSSLDGDNFLGPREIENTLRLIEKPENPVLIHYFSGQWGDGTSGRITLPTHMYREIGYLPNILPRQFDEMALILNSLSTYPQLRFISRPGVNIFELSRWAREFVVRNDLTIDHRTEDLCDAPIPENPRGIDYVERDRTLYFYQNINASYAGWLYSSKHDAKRWFLSKLITYQNAYARETECTENLYSIFEATGLRALRRADSRTLYGVNRNNFEFVEPWLNHYRELGVERFVIVDDGSDPPLSDQFVASDVHFVRPFYGTFRTAKSFWIKSLMLAFQAENSWVLTADIDEFLDLPAAPGEITALQSVIEKAIASGEETLTGILVDLMPDPDNCEITAGCLFDMMQWHYWRPCSRGYKYSSQRPIGWAFGEYWPMSFCLDVRFRLYGTIDCLRKIPLFRFQGGIDLNQGFHSLSRNGVEFERSDFISGDRPVYPIRHYKMGKVFGSNRQSGELYERTDQYFDRTRENLIHAQTIDRDYIRRCWRVTPFKRKYDGAGNFPFSKGVAAGLQELEAEYEGWNEGDAT